jgi:hypothetical protein
MGSLVFVDFSSPLCIYVPFDTGTFVNVSIFGSDRVARKSESELADEELDIILSVGTSNGRHVDNDRKWFVLQKRERL